jgi:hypothetical protein
LHAFKNKKIIKITYKFIQGITQKAVNFLISPGGRGKTCGPAPKYAKQEKIVKF